MRFRNSGVTFVGKKVTPNKPLIGAAFRVISILNFALKWWFFYDIAVSCENLSAFLLCSKVTPCRDRTHCQRHCNL